MTDTPNTRALARALIEELNHQDQEAEYLQREDETRARLKAKFETLNAEIDRLRLEQDALNQAAKRHPILASITAVLDGEITHAVFSDGYPSGPMIQTAAEAFTHLDNSGSGHPRQRARMLSILPPNKGRAYSHEPAAGHWTANLGWYVNEWADGSGLDYPIILCRSIEEAHDVVRRLFAEAVAKFDTVAPSDYLRRNTRYWQRFADTGVDLHWPPHILEHFRSQAEEQRESALAQARQVLDEILARPTPTGIDLTSTPTTGEAA